MLQPVLSRYGNVSFKLVITVFLHRVFFTDHQERADAETDAPIPRGDVVTVKSALKNVMTFHQ